MKKNGTEIIEIRISRAFMYYDHDANMMDRGNVIIRISLSLKIRVVSC